MIQRAPCDPTPQEIEIEEELEEVELDILHWSCLYENASEGVDGIKKMYLAKCNLALGKANGLRCALRILEGAV